MTQPAIRARMLTWNVWGQHGDWPTRQRALTAAIRSAQADIIALQETWRATGTDQVTTLAAELGYRHVQAHPPSYDDRGLAVLSRWPITRDAVLALPAGDAPDEQRITLAATVHTPAGDLPVYTTHLNWRLDHGHIRHQQLATTLAHLAARPAGALAAVLCGDLNAPPDADEIRALTGHTTLYAPGVVFQDAWAAAGRPEPGYTWDHANPYAAPDRYGNLRLDYVLVKWQPNRAGRVLDAALLTGNGQPTPASDHYGVLVDLDLTVP